MGNSIISPKNQPDLIDSLDYRALAAAMLLQAVKDAQSGSAGAKDWLLDAGLEFFEFATGETMDPEFWNGWVTKGCPGGKLKRKRGKKVDIENCGNSQLGDPRPEG